jgi:hypothetical protein
VYRHVTNACNRTGKTVTCFAIKPAKQAPALPAVEAGVMHRNWLLACLLLIAGSVLAAITVAFVESNMVGRVNPMAYLMAPVFGVVVSVLAIVIETIRIKVTSMFAPLSFVFLVGGSYVPAALLLYMLFAIPLSEISFLVLVPALLFNPITCYIFFCLHRKHA